RVPVGHCDDLVVRLPVVEHPHDTDDLGGHNAHRHHLDLRQDQDVQRVLVVAVTPGYKTVVGRVIHGRIQHPVQLEQAAFLVEFVLGARALRDLNDAVDDSRRAVSRRYIVPGIEFSHREKFDWAKVSLLRWLHTGICPEPPTIRMGLFPRFSARAFFAYACPEPGCRQPVPGRYHPAFGYRQSTLHAARSPPLWLPATRLPYYRQRTLHATCNAPSMLPAARPFDCPHTAPNKLSKNCQNAFF